MATHSFTLLMVNADGHAIMGRMHRPGEEKRMPAIIAPADYSAWLQTEPENASHFLLPFDASRMSAAPASKVVELPRQESLW